MRIHWLSGLAIAALAVGVACNRANKPADANLQNDLSLAAQQRANDSISALELSRTSGTTRRSPAPVRRTSSATRTSTSSGTVVRSSSGGEVVQKNTRRDAAIGAAAGAVIGAATSGNKVKGGLIGAAVGGIIGGVIGNNVDVKKKRPGG